MKKKTSIKAGTVHVPIMQELYDITNTNNPTELVKRVRELVRPHIPINRTGTSRIDEAFSGSRGSDQQRIAQAGLEWIDLLLAKNSDYGSSAWKRPVLTPEMEPRTAILVRMSDKIERIAQLSSKQAEVNETFDDTIRDLGAYCLLYLSYKAGPEIT